MKRVLFVCMGNICRSPAAEGVMRQQLAEAGLEDRVAVESAGTIDYHAGAPADPRMRRAAAARGYELTSRARQVRRADGAEFDLVVVADRENLADVAGVLGDAACEVRLLSSFLDPAAGWPVDVPDPYYGGVAGFETVLDMLEAACPRILEHVLAGSGPTD